MKNANYITHHQGLSWHLNQCTLAYKPSCICDLCVSTTCFYYAFESVCICLVFSVLQVYHLSSYRVIAKITAQIPRTVCHFLCILAYDPAFVLVYPEIMLLCSSLAHLILFLLPALYIFVLCTIIASFLLVLKWTVYGLFFSLLILDLIRASDSASFSIFIQSCYHTLHGLFTSLLELHCVTLTNAVQMQRQGRKSCFVQCLCVTKIMQAYILLQCSAIQLATPCHNVLSCKQLYFLHLNKVKKASQAMEIY